MLRKDNQESKQAFCFVATCENQTDGKNEACQRSHLSFVKKIVLKELPEIKERNTSKEKEKKRKIHIQEKIRLKQINELEAFRNQHKISLSGGNYVGATYYQIFTGRSRKIFQVLNYNIL